MVSHQFFPEQAGAALHVMAGFTNYGELIAKLGRYRIGKSCLYVKTLEDLQLPTLKKLICESVKLVQATNKGC